MSISEQPLQTKSKQLGVRVGDPIVPICPFTVLGTGKTYLGKAFDDRIGCALVVDIIRSLVKERHPNTVYGVGTVQEEVGTSWRSDQFLGR